MLDVGCDYVLTASAMNMFLTAAGSRRHWVSLAPQAALGAEIPSLKPGATVSWQSHTVAPGLWSTTPSKDLPMKHLNFYAH